LPWRDSNGRPRADDGRAQGYERAADAVRRQQEGLAGQIGVEEQLDAANVERGPAGGAARAAAGERYGQKIDPVTEENLVQHKPGGD